MSHLQSIDNVHDAAQVAARQLLATLALPSQASPADRLAALLQHLGPRVKIIQRPKQQPMGVRHQDATATLWMAERDLVAIAHLVGRCLLQPALPHALLDRNEVRFGAVFATTFLYA